MKRLRTYRLVGILLSFSLLVITSGVTVSKHYCLGRLQSVAYFHDSSKCLDMDDEMSAEMEDMECCDDVSEQIKADDIQQSHFDFEFDVIQCIISSVEDFQIKERVKIFEPAFYAHYKPPLIDRDISLLFQSFLI